ncbi:MAG: hypothetical protein Q8Q33_10505, partial [Chlamydiota bacterium]|nr:hypothetical protein [Chlamydiota bacterium]
GKALNYNFDTGMGEFMETEGYFPPWYVGGEKIIRHSKEKYEVLNGYVTTCDFKDPCYEHYPLYKLKAHRIVIYPGDKLIEYHVFLTFNDVPVLYLPWTVYYLKDIKSAFSFVPGHTREWGTFLLSKYTFFNNGNVRANAHVDYRSKRGWAAGVTGKYEFDAGKTVNGKARGNFKTYHAWDQARELDDGSTIEDNRYRLSLSHRQPSVYNTTIRAEVHKLSDEDILLDFFRKDFETSIRPYSYFDITKYHSKYSARLYYQPRLNDFFSEVEREPEVKFEARRQQLYDTPFYFTSLSSISNLTKTYANDESPSESAVRLDNYDEISYPKKYFGWLETNVWFGVRQTWYSHEKEVEDDVYRFAYSTGYEMGTKIYKVWDIDVPDWDINRLRHVIEPRFRHTYVDKPSVHRDKLIQFDGVDTLRQQNVIRPSLRNKLQTKRNGVNWDLVDLLTYIDYRLETEEEENSFSDIFIDLELRPLRNISVDFDWQVDPYEWQVDSFNTDLALYKEGKWRLSAGYRMIQDSSSLFTYDVSYRINQMWAFTAYNRWELDTGDLEEQEYSISSNFSCWTATFAFRETGDDVQFWVVFWINEFPDLELNIGN